MPVVQFDFCYFKAAGEAATTAILTGIDVETGMPAAYNHSSWNAAEYNEQSAAPSYNQIRRIP